MKYEGTRILVTGAAGFIGFHLAKALCTEGADVTGVDNINDYYDTALKEARLAQLEHFGNFRFIKLDIADKQAIDVLFAEGKFDYVVNLAAQAGVRYSIDHPDNYIQSNIIGFYNIIEACRTYPVKHLVYASSSSVYGNSTPAPFRTDADVSKPVSLYAATKKCDELLAYSYSHLYGIPATGLRFFTVYGPWGRPDMAIYSFTEKILAGETIKVFNNGDMLRDFTYIDDIISGIDAVILSPPKQNAEGDRYAIYNIGGNRPEKLLNFISELENALSEVYGKRIEAKKDFLPMQPGDVYMTYADMSALENDFGIRASVPLKEGLFEFAKWYKEYKNG